MTAHAPIKPCWQEAMIGSPAERCFRRHERIAAPERQLSATRAELAETMAALEHIIRECGALHKGPVAVEIASAALARARQRTERR